MTALIVIVFLIIFPVVAVTSIVVFFVATIRVAQNARNGISAIVTAAKHINEDHQS